MSAIENYLNRLTLEPAPPVPCWTARIVSRIANNLYELELTELLADSPSPLALPSRLNAWNMAESFSAPGVIPPDTNCILWRAGTGYVFFYPPACL